MNRFFRFLYPIIFIIIIQSHLQTLDYSLVVPDMTSSLGTAENPFDRIQFEELQLINPKTGQIPANIRIKELAFSSKLPIRKDFIGSSGRIAVNEYQMSGPYNLGGRTRAIKMDVRDENIILAGGVSGGIWKSIDAGSNWTKITSETERNSISTLTQDTRAGKENNWYFGTGELVGNSSRAIGAPFRGAGIYHSSDNGDTWQLLSSTNNNTFPDRFSSMFQYIWNIEINKKNTTQDEILIATYGGILRSTNGGNTWQVGIGEKLFDLDTGTDLNTSIVSFYSCLRQTKDGNFFAALSSASSNTEKRSKYAGFYFSADGSSWQKITPPGLAAYHERTVIGMNANGKEIYFLSQGDKSEFLWKYNVSSIDRNSVNGIWTNLSANIPNLGGQYGDFDSQGGYNMLIEVHPSQSNMVFIGGTNLYRSSDGFTSTQNTKWIGGYSPVNNASVYSGHYPDQHAILFFPSDNSKAISTNDGGIRYSSTCLSDSVKWSSLNNGFITSQFYSIAQRKDKDTNEMMGGMQDLGTYFRSSPGENPSWNRVLGGDGGYCAITPNRDFVYMEFQYGMIYRIALNKSNTITAYARVDPTDAGAGTQSYLFVNPYILDPLNPNRMFMIAGNYIWRNENLTQIPGGSQDKTSVNWTQLHNTFLDSNRIYTSIEKSLKDDILYAGIFAKRPSILKLKNASSPTQYESEFIFSSLFPDAGYISCISVHPEDPNHFVVTFSNYEIPSVFLTLDGGLTFTEIGGNLEDDPRGGGYGPSVRWAEIFPNENGTQYFLGTSTGLFSTSNPNGKNTIWAKEGQSTVGNAIVTMLDYRDIDGRLIVATHGSGTYQSFIQGAQRFDLSDTTNDSFVVEPAFPNPFDSEVSIAFTIPESDEVIINIYDQAGKLVRNILWGLQYKGPNRALWDGTNNAGVKVNPGLYLYKIIYKDKSQSGRIILE